MLQWFIDREAEVSELMEAMADVDKRGSMYFITGPTGIGKTAFCTNISSIASGKGFSVLTGRCIYENTVPYFPIHELFGRFSKTEKKEMYIPLGLSIAEGGERIAGGGWRNPNQEKLMVLENFVRKFNAIAKETPVLLVLDDIQWADSGTLGLVHYLSRTIQNMRMVALVAYNTEALATGGNSVFVDTVKNIHIERGCRTLEIKPFTIDQVAQLLTKILGTWKLPEELISRIYNLSEGNPFFAEELGRTILEEGIFDRESRRLKVSVNELDLPQSIKSVILHRISRLNEVERKVVRIAAVIGRRFEYPVLKGLGGMKEEELLDTIDRLRAEGILQENTGSVEGYEFTSNLIWETAYRDTSSQRRKLLHERVAAEIEKNHKDESRYWGEIGLHYILGGNFEKGVKYLILAANHAATNYGTEECFRSAVEAEKGLKNVQDPKLRDHYASEVYRLLGDCFVVKGEYALAIENYNRALQHCKDTEGKIRIWIKLTEPHMRRGELSSAIGVLEKALEEVGKEDYRTRGEVFRNMGWVHEKMGNYRRAVEFYEKSVELCKKHEDEIELGECYHRLGTGLFYLGDFKRARQYLEKGLEIRAKHRMKREIAISYNNLGIVLNNMGEHELALDYFMKAKKLWEDLGDLLGVAAVTNNIALIYGLRGERLEEIAFYRKVIEIVRRIRERETEMIVMTNLGLAYEDIGEYETAIECYRATIEISREMGEKRMQSNAMGSMATAYARLGRIEEAIEYAHYAIGMAEETGSMEFIGSANANMGEVMRIARRFEIAEEYFKKAGEIYQKIELDDGINTVKFYLAKLYIETERFEEAKRNLAEAMAFYTRSGNKSMLRKIQKELEKVHARTGTD
ncbi:MAG: tetratricopeptide repeat protein [Thermoplasmata archaeon]|nr:tetratricopeptide repeat protein [Thermoplasmata archaeon]